MIVLGILLVIIAIVIIAVRGSIIEEPEYVEDDAGNRGVVRPASPDWMQMFKAKWLGNVILIAGLAAVIIPQSIFFAKPGFQYHIITPLGGKYAVFTTGVKFVIPFSEVQTWQKYIDIKTVSAAEIESGATKDIEGIIVSEDDEDGGTGIPIRFIDQVRAKVSVSVRMQLPSDEASFLALVEEFRESKNLVTNTLVPTVREQVINTGYMFAAQDYISGAAADFRITLDEQLKDGGYQVYRKEFQDTTYLNTDIKQDGDRQIKDITTRYQVIKRTGKDGKPLRTEHDITKNNILVTQAIVDQIDLEDAFKQRLEKQRDISAEKRIEMEKIETAKAAQERIIAEGERDKAEERVKQEKKQVATLIEIETDFKKEETKKKLAEIQLQTEKINAQKMKVAADAKRTQLQLADGLSEAEKYMLDVELQKAQAYAEALKSLKLPSTYFSGGGDGKGDGDMLEMIMALMLKDQASKGKNK
jgi:hypothetical protein